MRSQSSSSTGFGFYLVSTVALILAGLVALFVIANFNEQPPPQIRGVDAVAGEIRTVPDVPDDERGVVKDVMSNVLIRLYERAFITPLPEATPPPSTASPTGRIDDLFTAEARTALSKDPGVFSLPAAIVVDRGRIAYQGMVTVDGGRGVQAFLDVRFEALGTPRGAPASTVEIRQVGTVLLLHTGDGWKVEGFDLKFSTRPASPPSPSPTS